MSRNKCDKKLPCFVCFRPCTKVGKTERNFLSMVLLLRMERYLPYPKNYMDPILNWEPCVTCVPKTISLYKKYVEKKEKAQWPRKRIGKSSNKENTEKPNTLKCDTQKKEKLQRKSSSVLCSNRPNEETNETENQPKDKGSRKCPKCFKLFGSQAGLWYHIQTIHKGVRFKCPHCPLSFTLETNVHRHIQTQHRQRKSSFQIAKILVPAASEKCSQCSKSFKKKTELKRHLLIAHEDYRPFNCPQCALSFRRKDHLERHILSKHATARPFKCLYKKCGMRFKRDDILNQHVRVAHKKRVKLTKETVKNDTENGQKTPQSKCPKCDSRFSFRYKLNQHLLEAHEDYKPFNCSKCEMSFRLKHHLNRHVISKHGTERPFKCPYKNCDIRCKRDDILNQHIRNAHKRKRV